MKGEPPLHEWLLGQPLVLLALAALVMAALGWRLEARQSRLGDHLRTLGFGALGLAVALIVIDAARSTRGSDFAMQLTPASEVQVVGQETVIPLGPDGHYRAIARINGHDIAVMIDTGATFTSLEESQAAQLGLAPNPGRLPSQMETANGTVFARFGLAQDFQLGSIKARNLDVAIMPDTNSTLAVVGMNLLSQLSTWRVENDRLVLSPKAP